MDWADDVAYSVHDLEDGLHAGLHHAGGAAPIRPSGRRSPSSPPPSTAPPGRSTAAELDEVFDDLLGAAVLAGGFDGGPRRLAALKNLTSELIGRFCRARAGGDAGPRAGRPGPLTRYAADLVVPRRQRLECALLKGVAAHYVMSRDGAAQAGPASGS